MSGGACKTCGKPLYSTRAAIEEAGLPPMSGAVAIRILAKRSNTYGTLSVWLTVGIVWLVLVIGTGLVIYST